MNNHRRKLAAAWVGVVAALVMSACSGGGGSGGNSGKPQVGGTASFAEPIGSPPTYIFPLYAGANATTTNVVYFQPLMWLPLYWFGHSDNELPTINYQLSIAKPPVFSDKNKTVTMTLKNYKWSDGKPVTSRDVEFFMNLLLANKNQSGNYTPGDWIDHVVGMSEPNPHTFVLKFNVTYNPAYLLGNGLSILQPIPQHSWDKTSATGAIGNYDETPSGAHAVYKYMNKESESLSTWDTNPLWQVVDGQWHLKPNTGFQVTGQTIMLPNHNYSGPDKPKISELDMLPFTSATAEFNALKSGTVDYGLVPITDTGALGSLKSQGYSIKPWYAWGMSFININYSNPTYAPLLKQLYIRQAMESLIDQPSYIQHILLNYGTPTYGPVPTYPKTAYLSPAVANNPYPFSPSYARQLLTDHGWTLANGGGAATCSRAGSGTNECGTGIAAGTKLSIPFEYSNADPTVSDEAQAMQTEFHSSGIQLVLKEGSINSVNADAFVCFEKTVKNCSAKSPALILLASPSFTYVPIYYPDGDGLFACGGGFNAGNYCDPQVDVAIQKVIHADTQSAAASALDSSQLLVAKQVPVIWFPNSLWQLSAISPKLGGVTAQDTTNHIYPSTWYLK